ncbi:MULTISPECIES: hypothetical protein [unclassified Meiothermus]|uniref:hypothetical protein n=1 Tax=unclassified Meiothermus TaxID=370471 RepID=UPI000D7BDD1C|nr:MULTISPECIES: hypothetical protein [unclassified Meiothermus]PZA06032.1 hypothetical protein DNA98_15345 [Meiothermus sp. Pnk-1]RYM36172.1 hypothetical protein EWH23_11205 [Meiothermus sp. PNK-Is4]
MLLSLGLLFPTAWAECAQAVDTMSEGIAGAEPEALSRALAEAIAQERGVFVSTRQRLLEYASTVVQDGRLQERGESSFEEEIRTRYADFIRLRQRGDPALQGWGCFAQRTPWGAPPYLLS